MIENSVIDEIREKADIVNIISDYVPIRKRGKNYLGLCPFHSERTPSFTVSQEKQLFHCFGCGEGGNVFSFLMKIENIPFVESAKILADKLGISFSISDKYNQQKDGINDELNKILEIASKYFCDSLRKSEIAMEYAKKRGLSDKCIEFFKIGFAPDSWNGLLNHLISKGFIPKAIEKAGLIIEREGMHSYYDRFRNRLMFPIFDAKGRIIAFGARTLDSSTPKYLNSPDSPVYNKSNILYGLNFSKDFIKSKNQVVIVEGFMDFIACFSFGIQNAAAAAGVALTENHAKILKRYTNNFVLVFDKDIAGEKASDRSIDMLKNLDINVRIADLSSGKDPDEIIRKEGKDYFLDIIVLSIPWMRYKLEKIINKNNIKEIEGRSIALKEASVLLSNEKDKIIQKEYAKLISDKLNFDPETVDAEIRRISHYKTSGVRIKNERVSRPISKIVKAERTILKIVVEDASYLEKIKNEFIEYEFSDAGIKAIFDLLLSNDLSKSGLSQSEICDRLSNEEAKKAFSAAAFDSDGVIDMDKTFLDCLNVIRSQKIKSQMEGIKQLIKKAEKEGEIGKIRDLQAKFGGYFEQIRAL